MERMVVSAHLALTSMMNGVLPLTVREAKFGMEHNVLVKVVTTSMEQFAYFV